LVELCIVFYNKYSHHKRYLRNHFAFKCYCQVKSANDEYWTIYGDFDCLFEIDDAGLVHSHSRLPALNKYDGNELAYLWNDVEYLGLSRTEPLDKVSL
jgi:hypothetical protein